MDNGSYAEQFREQGYLVVEDLVSADEVQQVRQRTEDLITGAVPGFPAEDIELEPGAKTVELATVRKLNRPAANDPVFLAHAGNPQVLGIVESIIGPDIKLYNSQCFMKPPGGVEKPYHQDSAYFAIEPMDLVTCWTALDDVTLEKGPMYVIPGSHRQGVLDHSQPWVVRDRRDKQVPDEAMDLNRETPCSCRRAVAPFTTACCCIDPRPTVPTARGAAWPSTTCRPAPAGPTAADPSQPMCSCRGRNSPAASKAFQPLEIGMHRVCRFLLEMS